MHILVTGGTGFTGSQVALRLLRRGDRVRILDTGRGLCFDELLAAGAELRTGSVADRETVRRAVEGTDAVLHLAAVFRDITAPDRTYREVNAEGTRMLAEESLRAGVGRFVYCSTEGVHGHVRKPPADEEGEIAPADIYQLTKWEGEVAAREVERQGLPLVIVRPTGIYGPGDPGRFRLLFQMVCRGRFFIVGDGRATYHPVYIDNLVDGFELALDHPEALGQAFLIGDESCLEWNELIERVARALDVRVTIHHLPFRPVWLGSALVEGVCRPFRIPPPLYRRRAEMFSHVRAFDVSKAKRMLGYEARVPLDEGLRRTGEWYRQNGHL